MQGSKEPQQLGADASKTAFTSKYASNENHDNALFLHHGLKDRQTTMVEPKDRRHGIGMENFADRAEAIMILNASICCIHRVEAHTHPTPNSSGPHPTP